MSNTRRIPIVEWVNLALLASACVVSLTACGSARPTQYAQGIPVAPAAPSFSPTLDAPITTGQPGYIGPAHQLPRSPHGRVLPQTYDTMKEPGLWRGDAPRATDGEDWLDLDSGPVVLGIPLALSNPPVPNGLDAAMARVCAKDMTDSILRLGLKDEISNYWPVRRRCFVATLYQSCLALHASFYEGMPDDERKAYGHLPAFLGSMAKNLAGTWKDRMCKRSPIDARQAAWIDTITIDIEAHINEVTNQ